MQPYGEFRSSRRRHHCLPAHLEGRFHRIFQEKYATAVSATAGAPPLLVPALDRAVANDDLLDSIDSLLPTGSPSKVLPRRYGRPASQAGALRDPHRDETTLPLGRRRVDHTTHRYPVRRIG